MDFSYPASLVPYSQLLVQRVCPGEPEISSPSSEGSRPRAFRSGLLLIPRPQPIYTFLQPQLIARAVHRLAFNQAVALVTRAALWDGFVLALGKRSLCLEMCNQDRVLEFLISCLMTEWPPLQC